MSIIDLKDKHKDSICYIIGGGESLQYLTNKYFESNGIIIALNKTIQKIQELSPSISVYSQQKDGNLNGRRACNYPDCNNCEFMKNPSPYTLLIHEHESRMCFENYKDRIVFDNIELGLHTHDFSALTAIKIGQWMGCKHFIFISFDSINNEYNSLYGKSYSENYKLQIGRQREFLKNISHEYITPTK